MKVNVTLIEKFLQNLCSVDEAELVWKHFHEHPEEMDFYLFDWNNNDSTMNPLKNEYLPLKIKEIIQANRPVRRNIWLVSISAAAILLICFIGFWISQEPIIGSVALEKSHTLIHINSGNEDLVLNSSDGSTILLKPKSEIRYLETFTADKRDFHLKGEATFQVVKDVLRPFNVYAGGTVTVALGTAFTVSAFDAHEEVLISLYSGKVVVQPGNTVLMPGDQVFVNTITLLARRNPHLNSSILFDRNPENKSAEESKKDLNLTFWNVPLEILFSRLEAEFSIVVDYDPKIIKNRFFTGSFKRSPNVETEIIQTVIQLNGLHFEKENNHFELTSLRRVQK